MSESNTQGLSLKKKAMLQALEKNLGIVTTSAKAAGITRQQHYNWMRQDAVYAEEVRSIDDITLDLAESKLYQAVNAGELSAIFFFLKCKGKKRGYIERVAVEDDSNTVQVVDFEFEVIK